MRSARQQVMNWVWDGRKPWWLVAPIARISCAIWGHQPAPLVCGWCLTYVGRRR